MFLLDPESVHRYDLKTASSLRRKPRQMASLSQTSLHPTSGSSEAASSALRKTLGPLLAPQSTPNLLGGSGDERPEERSAVAQAALAKLVEREAEPAAEHSDEQDIEIARLGIKTGEDAVNFLTAAANKGSAIKFVHLIHADAGTDFRPYTLDVVPAAVALARGDYFTMSKTGLVHCVLRKGANATECIAMNEWVRHSTFFNLLRSISFFKNFIPFKMFRQWRRNVRQKLYAEQRLRIQSRLFLARASFCAPCIEIKKETYGLKKATLVVTPKARIQSDPLEAFMEQQNATRKDAMVLCEATMKRVVEIAAAACEAVQTLDQNKIESEDPRKRLDALMAAKLESKNTKTKSMNATVEEKKAKRRLALRAAEDRSMLSDFVRLADCMMVEVVVVHVLHSFSGHLLADFTDIQHKIGLFEVSIGFDDTGMVFSPTLEDFYDMATRLADDVVNLVSRIPRVLDARGCAEHCTSAAFASKFEQLIRSLPAYNKFMASLRQKFSDDFEVSRRHNAQVAITAQPIYDASRTFDADTFHLEDDSYAEARREFERMLSWHKDLEKLRMRDSVGTIEVTSRQLKQMLAGFVETKLDLLKAIIRDKAQVQCAEVLKTLTKRVRLLEATPATLEEYATYVETTMDYDEREMRKLRAPVDQMYALLQSNDVKIPPDDLVALDEMHSYSTQYSEQLAKSKALKETDLQAHSEQLDRDIVTLNVKLNEFTSNLGTGSFVQAVHFDDPSRPREDVKRMTQRLDHFANLAKTYSSYKELFGFAADDCPPLKKASDRLKLVDKLWTSVADWHEAYHAWTQGDLTELQAEDVDRQMQLFAADAFSLNRKIKSDVTDKLAATIDGFKPLVPLVVDLGNQALLPRHWGKLYAAVGKTYDNTKPSTLSDFLEWGIQEHAELVSEVSGTASGEAQLEKGLEKMATAWDTLRFQTKDWRGGSHILVGIDEIQQELDDQLVKTQAMRGSRFVKPFLERAADWENMLTTLQEIIDNWLTVQAAWLYLEPIFSSDDIMRQIPQEGRMFKVVNQVWKESMAATVADPAVVSVARRQGLVESLKDANEKLERINKGLSDYLETKRLAFPRFFFLSNDELLSILAETKDPLLVQPHLKKCSFHRRCFDGICNLEFTERQDILAAFDGPVGKSERLEFAYDACQHKKINPRDSAGNVEVWLVEVEAIMKKSLAHAIDQSLADFHASDRDRWLESWQGQTILTVNQITWVLAVEAAIESGGDALKNLHSKRCTELLDVVKLVRGDIPKALRKTLGSLVVMDVHNRDVSLELSNANLKSPTDFDWLAHLRYYVRDLKKGQNSALSGEPGTIDCRMINASILYAYEYIGNCGRLVITPLTDRCYRTLMGAIHLNLGGAPEGPAGTGKTETTKDLGKAIAIQCVVTNCSDALDYKAMGKFFKGLAASGAWACFDEFNRIQLEVLSVIAQQVLTIQQAKARRAERFMFEGTDLPLKMTCCPFITMNPGYAGRAELPDNLKVLFRTVAMMVPDYAMIGEILLYSMGYTEAKALAVKIVTTYKLCSEQLSSQSHYDYGMRAVMAVLRAAGNLKRNEGHLNEAILVLRSIIDVNLPKFLSPDVPLFEGITSDLFPGVKIDPPDRSAMEAAFKDVCAKRNLQPTTYFWDKVVQIYDMMVVRHGFMIVGMPLSGKTMAWKVLADTLGLLHQTFPDETRWTNVISLVMNPKSITMGQLYGQFDPISTEWTDGCLAINYRNAAMSKVGTQADRKWIVLDGPVDAIWIENMNTVLDDNKKLCLMSGEIIAMSDTMSMIFEPMDLLVASPATVSRCGMIYLEPEQLGWQPLLDSWLYEWRKKEAVPKEGAEFDAEHTIRRFELELADEARLRVLFQWLVEPMMCLLRRDLKEMSPSVDSALLVSLLKQLEILYKESIPAGGSNADADLRTKHLESAFLFALVWSIGATVGGDGRKRFSAFLRAIIADVETVSAPEYNGVKTLLTMREWQSPASTAQLSFLNPLPSEGDCHDWCYDHKEGRWVSWIETLPQFDAPSDTKFSQILVPTVCTAQMSFFCCKMLPAGTRPLIVGPTGTGKSVCVAKALSKELSQDKFKAINLNFSAKTSANTTQNIIDGALTKRRKGVFGPPVGLSAVVMVDDLNMPEVETYGAQPPIELLRQLVDSGGYYDLKDKSWTTIIDTVVIALCFSEFDDATLTRIFTTIVSHAFNVGDLSENVRATGGAIVEATLRTYREAMRVLLPTPSKSHYTFNLRDFSRVIQGVLMADSSQIADGNAMARVWMHEALRVFADRLTDDHDRDWFVAHTKTMVDEVYKLKFDDALEHVRGDASSIGYAQLRSLFFGNYMLSPDEDVRPYAEIKDLAALQQTIEQYLVDFNAQSRKPMDLVMFRFAIEHISRIARILQMPGGNALLVGVGGSGRQSLTILAAEIAGCKLRRIEISKNYGMVEWHDDVKLILRDAGTGDKPVVFLFADTQIKLPAFTEDINNVLNGGEVPNLFANDEKVSINEAVRPLANAQFGKQAAGNMTPFELYAYFVQRVRERLHVVLAFSPIGCAIDWFTAWPRDALVAVADKKLADVELDDAIRPAIVETCQNFHTSAAELSEHFKQATGRITYVTPTSYLELLIAFKSALATRRATVVGQKTRYQNGLEQLASAENNVGNMQKELTDLQPVLKVSQEDTDRLMGEIEAKLPGVRKEEEQVGAEAAVAQREADAVKKQVDEVQADLDEAIPALNDALKALDTIKPNDINEIKVLAKPPATVKLVCEAVCVMLGEKPVKAPDPDDPSRKIMDYWPSAQKMLADKNFISRMKTYDKDNIPVKTISTLRDKYMTQDNFTPDAAAKASSAASGLCRWCYAMSTYDRVAKVVGPKKQALSKAQDALEVTMSNLAKKKASLEETRDALAALQSKLEASKKKKEELAAQVDLCAAKLVRAKKLIEDLGGEKIRWSGFVEELSGVFSNLTGDVLVSAALMAYLGPFTSKFREEQMKSWVSQIQALDIPRSASPTLAKTLGDPVKIRQAIVDGLPTDNFSIENAIVVWSAKRWPYAIDPDSQANRWIKCSESGNGLKTVKPTDDFVRTLESAIAYGTPVLLENCSADLPAVLEPLLLKQIFKSGGLDSIRLGDSTITYDLNFRRAQKRLFYMTSRERNPHLLPETAVKVSLLAFLVTPEGLADQLLGVVVAQERQDLEKKKNELVVEGATNAAKLKQIEDSILEILSSEGNILEDETAITTLGKSKVTSDTIKSKQEVAEATEKENDEARSKYYPGAFATQVLFFCISDLVNIEPTYSYSLTWFTNLFRRSIQNSEPADDVPTRLENLRRHFEFSLYQNVCRSLLEKDKLLFSFLLAVRIQANTENGGGGGGGFNAAEWRFLLTGGVGGDNPHRNPCSEWLSDKSWDELCRLSDISAFRGLKESFGAHKVGYKEIYDCATPHQSPLPGEWDDKLQGLRRLCVLRCIRPDKVSLAVQHFVIEVKGAKFVTPPPFDLQACFKESQRTTPLVFVLSPGSDPMAAILQAAAAETREVRSISLGQGQGPVAEKLISQSRRDGSWVVLRRVVELFLVIVYD
ncbi:hypothetical protein CTAYLR_001132 [Chrysophaeum taylorii]|uniref:AAA+ ATPase domain-containing protein n=1 Tax=Chrysophaeum taylorii TaxID=2483200 RepID=A0AAD7XS15_9STRA|nr:hypothetical protein CTAYLR_001132 [Chrysophaeum taylorii]